MYCLSSQVVGPFRAKWYKYVYSTLYVWLVARLIVLSGSQNRLDGNTVKTFRPLLCPFYGYSLVPLRCFEASWTSVADAAHRYDATTDSKAHRPFENLIIAQLLNKFTSCHVIRRFSFHEHATGPYPELDESSIHPTSNFFKVHCNVSFLSTPRPRKW
jgi:hypothetical protein